MKRTLKYEGCQVSYTVRGQGRPLVLLHGYLETGEVWEPLAERLAHNYCVITPDLPGHGLSGVIGETHTMELLAGAVRAVINDVSAVRDEEQNASAMRGEERNVSAMRGEEAGSGTSTCRVMMVGHSLGGYVTLAFARLFPGLLAGYVLFHSHPHADTPEATARRRREIAVVRAGKKNIMYPGNVKMMFATQNLERMASELKRSERIASNNSAAGIIAMLNGMIVRPSSRGIIERGGIPLLWIVGRHDLYFTPEKAVGGVVLPADARVVILEESGHLGFVEERERSVRLLEEFAASLSW